MNTNKQIIVIVIAAIVASLIAAIGYNQANSTEEIVSDKYAVHYIACAQWMYITKGNMTCILFKPMVEYRVNTLVKGPLFNHESYKVVEK